MRNPEFYQYELDIADIVEVWRRGSIIASWLLDLTAEALVEDADLSKFSRSCIGFRRRPLDHVGRSR